MSSNVCPFCKSPVPTPQSPCRSCGRGASGPSAGAGGGGWGDDDLGDGGLDLTRGGSMASHSAGPSAYAGGGVAFGDDDDPFAEDVPQGALELDLPSSHTAHTPRSMPVASPAHPAPPAYGAPPPSAPVPDLGFSLEAPASSPPLPSPRVDPSLPPGHASDPSLGQPPMPAPHVSVAPAPPPPPDPAAIIARFPPPPAKVWEAPGYAMKVLWRQFELRQDLTSLRNRRSPDVPLYERALRAYDTKTFALGLAITCVGLALASFIFFLPVILRFLRDPS